MRQPGAASYCFETYQMLAVQCDMTSSSHHIAWTLCIGAQRNVRLYTHEAVTDGQQGY